MTISDKKIASLIQQNTISQLLAGKNATLAVSDFESIATALWEKYKEEIRNDPVRQQENTEQDYSFSTGSQNVTKRIRVIKYNNKVMRFTTQIKGKKPTSGYPLYISLHGGGGTSEEDNNAQWLNQMGIWSDAVRLGLYITPRAIANAWNMHFLPESYVMYDRIIENMIAFEDVDPNKVYILGFSAGGDGVYQVTAQMGDRFAATNMMAGHPNGVSIENYRNVPFLIQMGENDSQYDRNKEAAKYDEKLNNAATAYGGYPHATFIHPGGSHNSWIQASSNMTQQQNPVLADLVKWLNEGNKSTVEKNTNSIVWLKVYKRDTNATRVRWDVKTLASSRNGVDDSGTHFWKSEARVWQFYWLEIGSDSSKYGNVDVSYDCSKNLIEIRECGDYLRLLVNNKMLDLTKPVEILISGNRWLVAPQLSLKAMVQTLVDRGDINYIYPTAIEVEKTASGVYVVKDGIQIDNQGKLRYLDNLRVYLTGKYSNKKGLWNYSANNTLVDGWLLATPFNAFGVPYSNFKQAVPGDYPLFKLSSQDAANPTQQSVPIQATVTKPADTPVKLLEGHSYKLYDEMYSVMINAKIFLDITTLTPPTDQFLAALTNALTYISNKPEAQRPIVRILYSNWAANAAGFPDLLLDASTFLKSILQNVDPKKKLTIYAGAINAGLEKGITTWALSWNHSKIVAADGQTAIVGGHNMWGEHYLGKNPVFDVSMKVQGESATHAQDYADKLWGYVLWRINDSLFDQLQKASGLVPLVHTAAYTYDAGSGISTTEESYIAQTITTAAGSHVSFVSNPKGQPDKDIYTRAKLAFPSQSGTIPILSIGREAGMDLSHVFPDRNSYLSEEGEPADQSMYQLFSMAENKIRMSLQSFSLVSTLAPVEWYVMTWDYTLFYEMAKAVRRGVIIEVVLSNRNAIAGGLSKTEAPYDGEDVKNVNKRLRDVLIKEFYLTAVEAEALVAQKFFVTNFRFSQDEMYPDDKGIKSIPLPNHAKTFMVDDRLFYIGSQNQYRCNLAEFGYVVEDATLAQSYIDNYWTKLWEQSRRTLDTTYDGSLEKFQNAEGTVFILDLLDNKRLDKTWQKTIKDYTDATSDAKAPYLDTLNDIISNAGYQTTADAVIELTKTQFFTNERPNNQPNDESDRFVKDLLTKKDLLTDFAVLIDSVNSSVADSDKAVNKFLKDKKYGCTVLQVYASFVGIRGSNLNYFKGKYAGVVVQDGEEAFDFRDQAAHEQDKSDFQRRLLSAEPSVGQMQKGSVLLIESDQSVKLDGVAILKPTYADNVLTWNQADGNATTGFITFSEIPRPGLKDPFSGVECFGDITYPNIGVAPLQGKISFYARKEAIKNPDNPVDPPLGSPSDWPIVVFIGLGIAVLLSVLGMGGYFFYQKAKRNSEWRRVGEPKKNNDYELEPLAKGIDDSSGSERDRIESTNQKEKSVTEEQVIRRRKFSTKLMNEANVTNKTQWANNAVQGEIKKDVDHYVTQNSKTINIDEVQSTFEQQFSDLVSQSMVDDDFARESSQVVEDIINSDFKNLVRENVDSIFREQIGQSITTSMIERMGTDDYKKYATDTMSSYLDASIKSQLSEPLVRRMETPISTSGDQNYLESLLTEEVVIRKAEYLKEPANKSDMQINISNELDNIVDRQQQTVAEKEAASGDLEEARKELSRTPSKENQDRVDELTKQVDEITQREEKLGRGSSRG